MSSARGIDAGLLAQAVNGREGCGEALADGLAAIEKGTAPAGDLVEDGARNDVARSELGARIDRRHEAIAVLVYQRRAFAAQRLRRKRRRVDPDVDSGGVKLHELRVADHGAGTSRHRDGFAARIRRVSRDGVEAAGAARRQHDRAGGKVFVDLFAGRTDAHEAHAFDAPVGDDQLVRLVAFQHAYRRRRPHFGDECIENCCARAVARHVHDPAARVRRFLAEREFAVGVTVEGHAKRDEVGDAGGPFRRNEVGYVGVDDAGAGGNRIGRVRSSPRRCCRPRPLRRPAPSRSRHPGQAGPPPAR